MKALYIAALCLSLVSCVDQQAAEFDDMTFKVRGSIYSAHADGPAPVLLRTLSQANECETLTKPDLALYQRCISINLPDIAKVSFTSAHTETQ